MVKRPRHSNKPKVDEPALATDSEARSRSIWLGWLTALLVATPLIPGESAGAQGTGIFLVIMWLVLLVSWALAQLLKQPVQLHLGGTTLALLAFLLVHTGSALIMAQFGHSRPALNMLWQWISFGVAFLLSRQIVRSQHEARALVSVMLALAVCLSSFGYYQYFHGMPLARLEYEQNPDQALLNAEVSAPAGSPQRKQFEARLYSTEPLATFGLTNSLACFLSPWLFFSVAIAATQWNRPNFSLTTLIAAVICAALIAGCWMLTKSRTSWLATAFGFALWGVYSRKSGWKPDWRLVVGGVAGLAVLAASAILAGGLDWLVLTESSKAILYRAQYWQASAQMVQDYPWLGCGAGNFQQTYSMYKLPEASETVSDPHNLLFEIWATAGTAALLLFMGVFLCFSWQVRSASRQTADTSSVSRLPALTTSSVFPVYAGGLLGCLLAYPAGLVVGFSPEAAFFSTLPLGGIVVWLWHSWVHEGELSLTILISALVILLVNLMAAGGISFAGISQSIWLIMALAILVAVPGESTVRLPTWGGGLLAMGAAGCLGAMYFTTYWPILEAGRLVSEGRLLGQQGRLDKAERAFIAASVADPHSREPLLYLADLRRSRWMESGQDTHYKAFREGIEQLLESDPRSYTLHLQCGDWMLAAFDKTQSQSDLMDAIAFYQAGLQRYPNYNRGHAQLAWAYGVAGQLDEASTAADRALKLDELNPHSEQKLKNLRLFSPPNTTVPGTPDPAIANAEQIMRVLRKNDDMGNNEE